MEENPTIQQSLNYLSKQPPCSQEALYIEGALHLIDSDHKPNNMVSKILNFMIKVTLSKNFDPKQFKIISSIPPQQWMKNQRQLLKCITSDKRLNQKYFSLFIKNHTSICNWYQLATRHRVDIEPYVFREALLQRKPQPSVQQNFNNQRLKESFYSKKKSLLIAQNQSISMKKPEFNRSSIISEKSGDCLSQTNNNESQNVSFMKPTFMPIGLRRQQPKSKQYSQPLKQHQKQPVLNSLTKQKQQLMGVFFNNMIELNQLQHKRKPLNLKLYKLKKKQNIDSHDLYMKTFDACNGRKYIFYDYQKHMKGLKQRNKYNLFLRNGFMQTNMENYINQQNHPQTLRHPDATVSKYQQFEDFKTLQQKKEKCSLLPINIVLNQKQLNNYQGLKKVVSDNKSNKVVFVNHQGKPITYYIKQQKKSNNKLSNNYKKLLQRNSSDVHHQKGKTMEVLNSRTLR